MLAVLEDEEVDGRVGEHSSKAHPETAVVRSDATLVPHFLCCLCDELVAVQAAFDGFALHAAGCVSWTRGRWIVMLTI